MGKGGEGSKGKDGNQLEMRNLRGSQMDRHCTGGGGKRIERQFHCIQVYSNQDIFMGECSSCSRWK